MMKRRPDLPSHMDGGPREPARRPRALSRLVDVPHPRHQRALDHRAERLVRLHPDDEQGRDRPLRAREGRREGDRDVTELSGKRRQFADVGDDVIGVRREIVARREPESTATATAPAARALSRSCRQSPTSATCPARRRSPGRRPAPCPARAWRRGRNRNRRRNPSSRQPSWSKWRRALASASLVASPIFRPIARSAVSTAAGSPTGVSDEAGDSGECVDFVAQCGKIVAAERRRPGHAVVRRGAANDRRSRRENAGYRLKMQAFGLCAHLLGVAGGERVNDSVDRRSPGQLEIDQRAVLVEQHALERRAALRIAINPPLKPPLTELIQSFPMARLANRHTRVKASSCVTMSAKFPK